MSIVKTKEEQYYSDLDLLSKCRNINETLFLQSAFLCPLWDTQNIRYVVTMKNDLVYDADEMAKYGMHINSDVTTWNVNLLDDYVSGVKKLNANALLVVGERTKFSAFHIDGCNECEVLNVVKHLYSILRKIFKIPNHAIVIYRDGGLGVILSILFSTPIKTVTLNPFQQLVTDLIIHYALCHSVNVSPLSVIGKYFPLPLGENIFTNERRSLISAKSFKEVHNLYSFLDNHRGMAPGWVQSSIGSVKIHKLREDLLPKTLSSKPATTLFIGYSILKYILSIKSKTKTRILLLILLLSRLNPASGIVVLSQCNISKITGLSINTVKNAIPKLCEDNYLQKVDYADSDLIRKKTKGAVCNGYILGNRFLDISNKHDENFSISSKDLLSLVIENNHKQFCTIYNMIDNLVVGSVKARRRNK